MMNFFENNMALLRKKSPRLGQQLDLTSDDETIETVEAKNGDFVPSVTLNGGRKLFVHSRFDPVVEASRFAAEVADGRDLVLVFGFGFAYHIEALIEKLDELAVILVIEKNSAMLKAALKARELSRILADERLIILAAPDEDMIAEALKGRSSGRVGFVTHRGSYQLDGAYYSSALELCRVYLSTKEVNIATLAKFEKLWGANIARNIGVFTEGIPVKCFYDKFTNIPALVVAAGPSLEHSLEFIRSAKEHAVIIAVDTAMRVLLKAGISPHFCVAVDPQLVNARYFEGLGFLDTVLIADPTVHPSVFHLYNGPVVVSGIAFDIMKWIENICGEKGEMTHGGSVSTNAFDLARRFGCSPIIMTGQDLAFTEGRAHARGSYMEEQIFLRTNRLRNIESHNRFQVTALPRIAVKGIRSEQVITNHKFMIFMTWFNKQRCPYLINSTYDGAFLAGVKHEETANAMTGSGIVDVSAIITSALNSNETGAQQKNDIRARLIKRVKKMLSELESLLPALEKAKGFSQNLISLFEDDKKEQAKVDYILKKLDETDRILESRSAVKDMLSLVSQKAIHTINEGYAIDGTDENTPQELLIAKRSNFLYSEFYTSCLFNKKALEVMLQLL